MMVSRQKTSFLHDSWEKTDRVKKRLHKRSSSVQQNIFPRGLHIHFGEHVVRIPDSCRSGKHRFSELLRYHNHPSLPPHSPIHHIHVHRMFTAIFVYSPKVPSMTFVKLTTSPTMIGLSTFLKHPGCHLPTMRSKHVRPRDRRYPKPFDGSNKECK